MYMVIKMKKEKNIINSFKYALEGIFTALKAEKNMKIHFLIIILVIVLGIILKISKAEWIICIILFGFVITLELVNTAIENTVDLITQEKNPKAKIAKDVAAGGVVITTINAVIVAYFLFFDKISNIGLQFIKNVANSPIHLAFAAFIITIIGILALIAIATTDKHKKLNKNFIPSGHAALAFAANTIIWLTTENVVIITLSLVLSILVAESRVESKVHKLSEVIFSSCVGIIIVLIIYGLALAALNLNV